MTSTATATPDLSLLQRMRAMRLPPPAQRREIRVKAKLSREDIAKELRARGHQVTAGAVAWWEKERAAGGFDPRPGKAIAYRQLLDRIKREMDTWNGADECSR